MSRTARALGLAALAATAWPAAAGAAYSPRLEARVDPPSPNAPAALTLILRQAQGESPNRTEVVRFPPEFRFNPGFAVQGCRSADEDRDQCPESSRIGTASAETELGPFSGPVYLTEDFRTIIYLRGFGGLESKVESRMRVTADGSVETVIDDLPPVRMTFAEVRLEGGERSLILTPRRCGSYPIRGRFTSHEGEVAESETAIEIAGCDTEPRIAGLVARPRAGRIDARWTLSAAGSRTAVVLERRVASRPADRWRRVVSTGGSASPGGNRVRVRARSGRRLRRGVYRLVVTVFSAHGQPADTRRSGPLIVR